MKKILLATTMLASAAGYAAADVAVSGDARMGVVSYEGNSTFDSRVRISFSGSGTTDGGLAFGGSIRADNAGDGADGTAGSVFISGAFGKISMGDVDSGDAAAVGQLSSVGYEGLGSGNSIGYAADGGFIGFGDNDLDLGSGGAKVLYTYSAGALTISASSGQLTNNDYYSSQTYGVGASYTAGDLTVAVGYGSNELTGEYWDYWDDYDASASVTDVSASVKYAMGDTTIKAIYQDKSADISYDGDSWNLGSMVTMGASVDHKINALKVTAYSISSDFSSDYYEFDATLNRYGVGVAYDLGGGATFKAGWAEIEAIDYYDTYTESAVDAGVNFSF